MEEMDLRMAFRAFRRAMERLEDEFGPWHSLPRQELFPGAEWPASEERLDRFLLDGAERPLAFLLDETHEEAALQWIRERTSPEDLPRIARQFARAARRLAELYRQLRWEWLRERIDRVIAGLEQIRQAGGDPDRAWAKAQRLVLVELLGAQLSPVEGGEEWEEE